VGNWNPNAPQLFGLEWAPDIGTTTAITTSQGATAFIQSSQAELIAGLHIRPRDPASWDGSTTAQLIADVCRNDGSTVPTGRAVSSYLPNADNARAGWVGEAPGLVTTNLFAHVNERFAEFDTSDSIFHNSSGAPHSATIQFGFNTSGFAANRRVSHIRLRTWVRGGSIEFAWLFGGVAYGKYETGYNGIKTKNGGFTPREYVYGELCPWTGLPWTQTDIVNLSNGNAYLRVDRADRATGFYTPTVASIEILVIHYAENRIATAVGAAGGIGGEPSDVYLAFPATAPWSKLADTRYAITVRPAKGTSYDSSFYWRRLSSSTVTALGEAWSHLPTWLDGTGVQMLDAADGTPSGDILKYDPSSAFAMTMDRYATDFVQTANGMTSGLEVLQRYDFAPGTATGTASPDVRTAGTSLGSRTGGLTGGFWGLDSSLPPNNRAVRVGEGGGSVLVASYDPPDTAVFTYAMVVRFNKFEANHTLISGAGTGYEVIALDAGTGYQIRVQKTGGGTVATSTVTITDVWQDHLIVVSMNGGTASTRIVIDGVLCTGSITAQTNGAATTRFLGSTATTGNYVSISAYGEWSRQITTTEEASLLRSCQWDYQPTAVLQGVQSPMQFYATDLQDRIAEAVTDNLAPDLLRMDCRWHDIQATNGGPYDWSKLDHAVNLAVANGQQILMTVLGSPTWANGGTSEYSVPQTGAAQTTWITNYAAFITVAVNRYKDRVKRWELGNEMNFGGPGVGFWQSLAPNSTSTTSFTAGTSTTLALTSAATFPTSGSGAIQKPGVSRVDFTWTGKTGNQLTGITASGGSVHATGAVVQQLTATQWVTDYVAWANALYTAIKAADPTAHLCTGGILGWTAIGQGLTGLAFTALEVTLGLNTNFNFGIHPYPGGDVGPRVVPDFDNSFGGAIRKLRDHMVISGRDSKAIWVTEFGWYFSADQDTAPHLATTSTYITQAYADLRAYQSKWVRLASYFIDFDRPTSGFYGLLTGATAAGSGTIVGPELAPKSTADTYRTIARTVQYIHTEGKFSSDSQPYADVETANMRRNTVTQQQLRANVDQHVGAVQMLVRPSTTTDNRLTVQFSDLTAGGVSIAPAITISREDVLNEGLAVGDWYVFQKQLLTDAYLIAGRDYTVSFTADDDGWSLLGVKVNRVVDANGNDTYPDAPATFGGTLSYATLDGAVMVSGAEIPLVLGVRPTPVSAFDATVQRRSLGTFRGACLNLAAPGPLESIEYVRLTWDRTDLCVRIAHDLDHRTAAEDALFPPGTEYGFTATGIKYAWVAPDGPIIGYATDANAAIWNTPECAFTGGADPSCVQVANALGSRTPEDVALLTNATFNAGVWRAQGHIIGYSLFEDSEVWSSVTCAYNRGPAFGSTEIQRWDDVTGEWQQIALLTDADVHQFDDHEMRRNVPSSYRIRQIREDGISSAWSGGRAGPTATPALDGAALVFTSNDDPQLNVAYTDVYDAQVATREFAFLDAGEVQFRKLYGVDKQIALSPTESIGMSFTRTLLLQALTAPGVPGVPVFDRLRAIAKAPILHVCVTDHEGNRWFAALQVTAGSIRQPNDIYEATVTVTEIVGPEPVSKADAALGYPWFGLSGRWGVEPVSVRSVLYGGDALRAPLATLYGGDAFTTGPRVYGGTADTSAAAVTIDGVAMLVASESDLNLAVTDFPEPDGTFTIEIDHSSPADDGAGLAVRIADESNFLYVVVNDSTGELEAGQVLSRTRIVFGTFPAPPNGTDFGCAVRGSSEDGGTTFDVLSLGAVVGSFTITDSIYDGATLAGLAMLNDATSSPPVRWDNLRWRNVVNGVTQALDFTYN
jgi:hypothetical protein